MLVPLPQGEVGGGSLNVEVQRHVQMGRRRTLIWLISTDIPLHLCALA